MPAGLSSRVGCRAKARMHESGPKAPKLEMCRGTIFCLLQTASQHVARERHFLVGKACAGARLCRLVAHTWCSTSQASVWLPHCRWRKIRESFAKVPAMFQLELPKPCTFFLKERAVFQMELPKCALRAALVPNLLTVGLELPTSAYVTANLVYSRKG